MSAHTVALDPKTAEILSALGDGIGIDSDIPQQIQVQIDDLGSGGGGTDVLPIVHALERVTTYLSRDQVETGTQLATVISRCADEAAKLAADRHEATLDQLHEQHEEVTNYLHSIDEHMGRIADALEKIAGVAK